MAFPPAFDHVWDLTQPPDTQLANLLGQDIRNLKDDVMQRLSLLSGTLANRPIPEIVNATWGGAGFGLLYLATDTGQTFQWNGAAWVEVPLLERVIASASVNLAGQAAAIATTTFFTPTLSGIYRVSADLIITTVGTGGNIFFTIGWNNGVSAQANSSPGIGTTVLGNENGYPVNSTAVGFGFFAAAGQNITYATTFAGVTGAPQYSFRTRLEYLG